MDPTRQAKRGKQGSVSAQQPPQQTAQQPAEQQTAQAWEVAQNLLSAAGVTSTQPAPDAQTNNRLISISGMDGKVSPYVLKLLGLSLGQMALSFLLIEAIAYSVQSLWLLWTFFALTVIMILVVQFFGSHLQSLFAALGTLVLFVTIESIYLGAVYSCHCYLEITGVMSCLTLLLPILALYTLLSSRRFSMAWGGLCAFALVAFLFAVALSLRLIQETKKNDVETKDWYVCEWFRDYTSIPIPTFVITAVMGLCACLYFVHSICVLVRGEHVPHVSRGNVPLALLYINTDFVRIFLGCLEMLGIRELMRKN